MSGRIVLRVGQPPDVGIGAVAYYQRHPASGRDGRRRRAPRPAAARRTPCAKYVEMLLISSLPPSTTVPLLVECAATSNQALPLSDRTFVKPKTNRSRGRCRSAAAVVEGARRAGSIPLTSSSESRLLPGGPARQLRAAEALFERLLPPGAGRQARCRCFCAGRFAASTARNRSPGLAGRRRTVSSR